MNHLKLIASDCYYLDRMTLNWMKIITFTVSQRKCELVVIHRRWDKPKCPWGNNHSQRVPVIGNPPQNHTPGIEWHRVYLWSQTHPTLLQPNYPWWGNSFSMNHLLIKLMYTRQLWHDLYYQITWNKIIDTLTNNWFLCCIYLHWNILIKLTIFNLFYFYLSLLATFHLFENRKIWKLKINGTKKRTVGLPI